MTTALSRHRPSGALSQGELILGVLPCLACLTGTPFAGASPAAGALALPLPRTCPFSSSSAGHPLRRGGGLLAYDVLINSLLANNCTRAITSMILPR